MSGEDRLHDAVDLVAHQPDVSRLVGCAGAVIQAKSQHS